MNTFYESRELDRLRKSSNEKINKAKEILKDNEKNINSHIDKIQNNYRSRGESTMFDDIVFDEFTMLDEGYKAKQYKENKEREKRREEANEEIRLGRRSDAHFDSAQFKYDPKVTKTKIDKDDDSLPDTVKGKLKRGYHDDYELTEKKDKNAAKKYREEVFAAYNRKDSGAKVGNKDYQRRKNGAGDAILRHNRRHPDSKIESALMMIDDYNSEFAY